MSENVSPPKSKRNIILFGCGIVALLVLAVLVGAGAFLYWHISEHNRVAEEEMQREITRIKAEFEDKRLELEEEAAVEAEMWERVRQGQEKAARQQDNHDNE